MIGLEDRRSLAQDIATANTSGARLHLACATTGIHLRTLQRWKASVGFGGLMGGDGRPAAVRPT
jgi:putative transposase